MHFRIPSTETVTCEIATLSVADTEICTCPEDVESAETLAPLFGFEMTTEGGVRSDTATLLTLTEIEEVPMFPDESKALTVSVWVPFENVAEFHEKENGEAETMATCWLSTRNWTLVIVRLDVAVPCTETVPDIVDPFAGLEIETAGGGIETALCAAETAL